MKGSGILLITKQDCVATIRGNMKRMRDHAFTTIFAIILIIPVIAAITGVSIFLLTEDSVLGDMISTGDFFFTIFIIVTGRALSNSIRHIYKDPTTELLRIIPISARKVFLGKLFTVITLTLFTFSIFYAVFLLFFIGIYPDPITTGDFLIYSGYIYLIAIFGTLTGFIIPLVYYLPSSMRARILLTVIPPIIAGSFLINVSNLGTTTGNVQGGTLFPAVLTFLTLILFTIVSSMAWYFNEAVLTYLPGFETEKNQTPRLVTIIDAFSRKGNDGASFIPHSSVVVAKELLTTLRDSYFHIYAGMTVILTVMGVFMVISIPQEFLDESWGWLVMPMIVSFMLFIEGAFMVTLGSLSLIGKEGKRLWVLRSLPVSGYEVLHGKAVSVIIPSILGGYALALPLLYITELPLGQNLVFLVLTLSIIFSFSGIGILAGVKYPNFTEGARGSPDIVFQMFVLFICLVFLGFIIVPPMTFYYNYGTAHGLLVSFIVLLFSYAVLVNGIRTGEKIFDRLSAEEYES